MTDSQARYLQAKEKLNPAQKLAVETIYGPVLAIAGPGTGKTQVLTLRIAEILVKTDAHPKNILALTFTEAGVVAMRDRLRTFIGPNAHSVKISTFHGFCSEIIARYPEKFLSTRRMETVEGIVKLQMMKAILDSGDCEYLVSLNVPNLYLKTILSKISILKREDFSPEDFKKVVIKQQQDYEAIPDEEKINPKTGHLKEKYARQLKDIHKWEELSGIYEKYTAELRKNSLVDFDDQILFVLKALKSDEELRANVREEVLFLLSDEFQDSNGAQMELLEIIAGDEPNPNLFVVGDDDQSIYRFQGANLENVRRFMQHFPSAAKIPLTENYRSTPEIIAFAEASIENSIDRLTNYIPDLDKHLTAAKEPSGPKPQVYHLSTAEAERYFVLRKIQELIESDIPHSEIVVLIRKNYEALEILHYFEQNGLPVVFDTRDDVLKDIRIQQFINLLRLIAEPRENSLFFDVLHYPVWGISPPDIWKIWDKLRANKGAFFDFFQKVCAVDPNFDQASLFAEAENNTTEIDIHGLCKKLVIWQQDLFDYSFADFFRKVLQESGFLDFLLKENTRLETLNHFSSLSAEITHLTEAHPGLTLQGFLEIIALREEFHEPITERTLQVPENVVRIMTAHKSKGLEFEAVFVINAVSGNWGDTRDVDKLRLPEGILTLPISPESEIEENRRLFFVAATRAKKQLFFTVPKVSLSGKAQSQSRYLDEVPEKFYESGNSLPYEEQVFLRLKAELTHHDHPSYREAEGFFKGLIDPNVFAISATALETYRVCPRKFLFETLIKLPRPRQMPLLLGNAIHSALEAYFNDYIILGAQPEPRSAFDALRNNLSRSALLEKDLFALYKQGADILTKYFTFYAQGFAMPHKTELNFRNHGILLDEHIPITGKIDKVEWIDREKKTVRIIDYKTSAAKSENEIRGLRGSDANNLNAGSIYRQLLFYYLLTAHSRKIDFVPEIFRIEFLKPDDKDRFKFVDFTITETDTLELTEEIKRMWDEVTSLAFLDKDTVCATTQVEGSCKYCELYRGE